MKALTFHGCPPGWVCVRWLPVTPETGAIESEGRKLYVGELPGGASADVNLPDGPGIASVAYKHNESGKSHGLWFLTGADGSMVGWDGGLKLVRNMGKRL